MTGKRRKRHGPEEIVRKLRDADAMLSSGKEVAAVLQSLEVSEATYLRWRIHYLLNEVVDKFETLDNDGVKLDPPTKDGLIFGLSAIDPRPNVIKRYGLTQAGVSVTQAKDEAGK